MKTITTIIVAITGILIVLGFVSVMLWAMLQDKKENKCNMEHTIYKYDESNKVIETIKYTAWEERK